jgi:hypothetical protein
MRLTKIKKLIERLVKEELTPSTLIPSFDENPIQFITQKYPSLKKEMVDLLTDRFTDYITGIYIMAPKPTTFKIVLHNGQEFYLIYLGKSYVCKVEGKRYYMNTLSEKQGAILAIADLLQLGPPIGAQGPDEEDGADPEEPKSKSSGGGGGGGNPYYTPVGEREGAEGEEGAEGAEGEEEPSAEGGEEAGTEDEDELEKALKETKIRFI